MKIIIHRKKQFASSLVPFYIAINKEKDEIINAITNKEEIMVYPIKSGETIEFETENKISTIICMNNNFEDSKIYPLCFTELIKIKENSTLLLEQTKFFKKVELKLSIDNDNKLDKKRIKMKNIII